MLPIVRAAVSELGDTSRGKKYNDWYGWTNYQPFCDSGLCYAAEKAGEHGVIGKYAYCSSHLKFLKTTGTYFTNSREARHGDIVFFQYDGGDLDHVGIIEKVSLSHIHTVEFNAGNREVLRQAHLHEYRATNDFIRPNYIGGEYSPVLPIPAFWVVSLEPCYWRLRPTTQSPVIKHYGSGAEIECIEEVKGEYVEYPSGLASDIWYKSKISSLYCWSPILSRM